MVGVEMRGVIDKQPGMIANLTGLILFMLVLMSLPGPPAVAEDVDVYDDNYRLQYRIRGDKVYDRDYRLKYRTDGDKVYDGDYRLRYRLERKK